MGHEMGWELHRNLDREIAWLIPGAARKPAWLEPHTPRGERQDVIREHWGI